MVLDKQRLRDSGTSPTTYALHTNLNLFTNSSSEIKQGLTT